MPSDSAGSCARYRQRSMPKYPALSPGAVLAPVDAFVKRVS